MSKAVFVSKSILGVILSLSLHCTVEAQVIPFPPIGPAPLPSLPGIGGILGGGGGGILGGGGGLLSPSSPIVPNNPFVAAARTSAESQALPLNYTLYGVTVRSVQGSAPAGSGFSVTCDSSEIAVGAFCLDVQSTGENALLTSGVATYRTAACLWKNNGIYRVSASCLSYKPLAGDSFANSYHPRDPLP